MLAAGGSQFKLPVPGADGENVYMAHDVISGKISVKGKKVVIIGAGVTGLEAAEMLAPENEKVSIVEMTANVGDPLYPSLKVWMGKQMAELGVDILTLQGLTEVQPGKVILRSSTTAFKKELDADVVINAAGVRPNRDIVDKMRASFDNVITVGDSTAPGLIGDALREANSKAWVF